MARFISITDIIQQQIQATVKQSTAPIGTPTAFVLGQQEFKEQVSSPPQGVFRWGFSTWGIDTITGISMPDGSTYSG